MPTETQEPTTKSPDQFRQTHDVTFSIRYRSTASSAVNAKPTLTEGDACQTNEGADQRNCLRNSRLGAFSLSLVKTISKYPLEFSVQAEASTATTALQVRSSVGGVMAENSTSLIVKSGRQRFSPMACLTLISPMVVARTDAQARFISIVCFLRKNLETVKSSPARSRRRLWLRRLPKAGAERDREARAIDGQAQGGDHGETAQLRACDVHDSPATDRNDEGAAGDADDWPQRAPCGLK